MENGNTNEIILFPNCRFMLGGLDETKTLIKKRLTESLIHFGKIIIHKNFVD
jgi:hypothetical protein